MNLNGYFSPETMRRRLAVAKEEEPAELLLTNGRLVNVYSSEIIETNLAIQDGLIAAAGSQYLEGKDVIDLEGKYLAPGLIDAHLHIESTLLFPPELARLVVAHGTTCIINDPHEIANVLGDVGVTMILHAFEGLPCDFFSTVPSCVPATSMETAGAEVTAQQVEELLKHPRVVGLGEMMNYPGLIDGDDEVLAKVIAAHKEGRVIDGHAPSVSGANLQAYLSAGITTDHECVTAAEALEKLRSGMKIIIRHGSASSSLEELLPLVNEATVDSFMFGSDDREAGELLARGHLDDLLKTAVSLGADPVQAIKIATINAARHYRLYNRGALAPGCLADVVVFKDLGDFEVDLVVKNGRVAARSGKTIAEIPPFTPLEKALQSVKIGREISRDDFIINMPPGKTAVIGIVPGQLVTEKLMIDLPRYEDGTAVIKPESGLNKIAVIERHKGSGRVTVGLVKGMGLREGALASSVAHDSHNILVTGVEEVAMAAAVNELARFGGGFVVVDGSGSVRARLPLPVGGLMSAEPAEAVAAGMEKILEAAGELGTGLVQPFLTLSFLALPVIPSLKITDRGLFDVDNFTFL